MKVEKSRARRHAAGRIGGRERRVKKGYEEGEEGGEAEEEGREVREAAKV